VCCQIKLHFVLFGTQVPSDLTATLTSMSAAARGSGILSKNQNKETAADVADVKLDSVFSFPSCHIRSAGHRLSIWSSQIFVEMWKFHEKFLQTGQPKKFCHLCWEESCLG